MSHVAADFALYSKGLFLRGFGELSLKRIFLSAVTSFFSSVSSFTFRQSAAFSCLVQGDSVNLMSLAMRTVCPDFFGNIHGYLYQLSIKETHAFLYFFCFPRTEISIASAGASI